ncbi:MAG: calcium/sodium antiporter [Candidatus Cyclobacteriaceae bacterium M3_2C_046]
MLLNSLIFIISLVVLIAGGDFLVKGASSIAIKAHLSPLVVGLTIVAFGTSAPELFISINSALSGSPDIAIGNVVGSNICNLALVLGAAAFIYPINIKSESLKIDWPVAMGASVLLYLFILNFEIGRLEGVIFLMILLTYLVFIIRKSRKDTKKLKQLEQEIELPKETSKHLWKDLLFIFLGCLGLYFGSDWFVASAKFLAGNLNISERVIGISIVAVGTSLPELITACVAAFRKETDLALGNLIGSNIFNIFSILGITSIIKSISVSAPIINFDILWMMSITFIILPMMLTQKTIERWEGAILLAIYVAYIYMVFS